MKTRYLVTVETRRGAAAPSVERLDDAVWGCLRHPEDFLSVSVDKLKAEGVKEPDVTFGNNLFAYGEVRKGRCVLLDFFNTEKKAANAAKRARMNTMLSFRKDGTFAAFRFNPRTSAWDMV